METSRIPGAGLHFSRIGLGTWAMGGWMWGGTDEQESIRTIHSAIDRGITLIDMAGVCLTKTRQKAQRSSYLLAWPCLLHALCLDS